MRRKQTFALMAGVIALAMTSCGGGTTQVIVQQSQVVQEPKVDVDTIEAVEPIKDVLSIEEAVRLLQASEDRAAVMRKLGYKQKEGYEVSRMDKYDVMYYKNCKLPRMLREGVYQNYPQPPGERHLQLCGLHRQDRDRGVQHQGLQQPGGASESLRVQVGGGWLRGRVQQRGL